MLKNMGLLAVTGEGIFYQNQTWINFLCFEKTVGDKYQREFPNSQLQIQCTEAKFNKRFVNFVESKDFKARLYENNLLVLEGDNAVLIIKTVMSELFP